MISKTLLDAATTDMGDFPAIRHWISQHVAFDQMKRMTNDKATATCQCRLMASPTRMPVAVARRASRPLVTTALSVLLAFFPKCPVCWATYMSIFGSVGLARTPYAAWLHPLLIGLCGLNLLLLKRASKNGRGPFLLGLAGVAVVLAGRALFPETRWLVFFGMAAMIASSLLGTPTAARPGPVTSHTARKEGHS